MCLLSYNGLSKFERCLRSFFPTCLRYYVNICKCNEMSVGDCSPKGACKHRNTKRSLHDTANFINNVSTHYPRSTCRHVLQSFCYLTHFSDINFSQTGERAPLWPDLHSVSNTMFKDTQSSQQFNIFNNYFSFISKY